MSAGFLKPVTGFFKKYTALLPSIGITVVALLLFLPTMLVGSKVEENMEKSVSTAKTVGQLMRDVPSKDDPVRIQLYMDRLEDEAAKIDEMAVCSSQRDLISYSVFPPIATSAQLYEDFGRKYREAVNVLLESINALDAPSDAEIRAQGGGTNVSGLRASHSRTSSNVEDNPMVDALCLRRSQNISCYAHPSVFTWYDFWQAYEFAGQNQAQEDCWDSQVAFWIYEDIVETIRKMNEGSQKVSSSSVKRLQRVGFSESGTMGGYRGGSMTGGRRRSNTPIFRDRPNYISLSPASAGQTGMVAGAKKSLLYSNFVAESPTARDSDEDVDVIHFSLSVLVDNRSVMAFIKELCSEKQHTFRTDFKEDGQRFEARHNQITILKSDLTVVDKQAAEHELYRYGDGAVMQMDLVCEYQFYRDAYDVIKPDPIKEMLGQAAPAQETGNTGNAGNPGFDGLGF